MPHIGVSLYPGRDEETKKAMAKDIKRVLVNELKYPADTVSVSIVEIEADNFQDEINKRYDHKDLFETSDYVK